MAASSDGLLITCTGPATSGRNLISVNTHPSSPPDHNLVSVDTSRAEQKWVVEVRCSRRHAFAPTPLHTFWLWAVHTVASLRYQGRSPLEQDVSTDKLAFGTPSVSHVSSRAVTNCKRRQERFRASASSPYRRTAKPTPKPYAQRAAIRTHILGSCSCTPLRPSSARTSTHGSAHLLGGLRATGREAVAPTRKRLCEHNRAPFRVKRHSNSPRALVHANSCTHHPYRFTHLRTEVDD